MNDQFKTSINPTLKQDLEIYLTNRDERFWEDRIHYPLSRLARDIKDRKFSHTYFANISSDQELTHEMVAYAHLQLNKFRHGKMNIISWCHLMMRQYLLHKMESSLNIMRVRDGRTLDPLPMDAEVVLSNEMVVFPPEIDPMDSYYLEQLKLWWENNAPRLLNPYKEKYRSALLRMFDPEISALRKSEWINYIMSKTKIGRTCVQRLFYVFIRVNQLIYKGYLTTGKIHYDFSSKIPAGDRRNNKTLGYLDTFTKEQRREYNRQYRLSIGKETLRRYHREYYQRKKLRLASGA